MKIRQIRNATLIIDYGGKRFLTDPWFAAKDAIPGFEGTPNSHLRNPTVDLPVPIRDLVDVSVQLVKTEATERVQERAKEVAEEGIRVNAVRPGHIYTEIHAAGGEPGRVDRVKAAVPMKRGGQPREVAQAILWLLSDEASYVTGTILDVTGGR